jgi:hypothetical protein
MKRVASIALASVVIAGLVPLTSTVIAQTPSVSATVNVSVPGLYGQINIGGFPQPELLLPRPVVALPPPAAVVVAPPQPLYLHVPPGHEKHWEKHCHEYNACGRPVYFVSDRWYHEVYTPHQHGNYDDERGKHDHEDGDHGHGHGHGEGHDHDHDHD